MSKSFRKPANSDQTLIRLARRVSFSIVVLLISSCDQPMQANTPHDPKFDDPKLAAESLRDPEKFFRGMTIVAKDLGSPARYPGGWDAGAGFLVVSNQPKGYGFGATVLKKGQSRVLLVEKSKIPIYQNTKITILDARRISYQTSISGQCRHARFPLRPDSSPSVSIAAIVTGYGPAYQRPLSKLWQHVSCMHESTGVRQAWWINPDTGRIVPMDADGVVCIASSVICENNP